MVTKNQLRIQMLNVLQGGILSVQTMDAIKEELSEDELGALISMSTDWYPDIKLQKNFDNPSWLVDVTKKYNNVLNSLDVFSVLRGSYIEVLDNVLRYLDFRRENSDVGCKDIFDAVYAYVKILRCRCDMPDISVWNQENEMLNKIIKSSEPELNKLVMALLCTFSFDEKHILLVEDFFHKRKDLIFDYVQIIGNKRCHFIF